MDYEKEINELKKKLNNLTEAYLQSQRNQVPVVEKTDESYNKIPQVDENTTGVGENSLGLLDVAELSDENSSAIEDVAGLADENSTAIEDIAELVGDLEERVAALEEK
jgi:methyl-accepting chemotaxis protein